ncbi:amidase domain-containing protein [Staphylococcus lugdunensis]|uniref:amidase domain-containing protein n=1 Tax=Staphylococcus lugdunensis TaxID=28035 RepID=UPI000A1212D1|nr:amidase domain-containing protein [Staphylococcus lugdunensis]ARJ26380.1 N-acetylmuramoyl-L-alanine amidase [Staphylococcus lugdunensis]MCH8673394.1 amidase domain-containing protein [Staphylococcus lugdunensis]MCH8676033.1 amidase domain-containing protein [Staphylococcus lugdunensis]MCI2752143.1 amidase domain-containing protein [Staphylococcus lugdunensis]MCI2761458.1 amidase domain-containing protein [Staphylococcus lugdunensis]
MSKQKIFIYLLSTTLIVPTFTSDIAHATELTNQSHNESNHASVDKSDNDDTSDTNDEQTTKKQEKSAKTTKFKQYTRAKKASHDEDDLSIFNKLFSDDTLSSNYLNPRGQQDSLSELLTAIFSSDSETTEHTAQDTSDDMEPAAEQQDKASTTDSTEQHSTTTSEQNDQSAKDATTDDNKVSDALDELDNLDDASNHAQDTQRRHDSEASKDDDKETSSEEKPHQEAPSHDTAQDKQNDSNKEATDSASDAVIDSILDEYSDNAKKTQQDYTQDKTSDKHKQSNATTTTHPKYAHIDVKKDRETRHQIDNPQLPSKDSVSHATVPAQSFEEATKQANTRATSLFATMPQASDNASSTDDLSVVDSQQTRTFIKAIGTDAHQLGQENDIYASVMIAQAILESDSGQSTLAKAPNFNLFGIKGAYKGESSEFNTLEATANNQLYSIQAAFRKYPNKKASLEDYVQLIKEGIDGNATIYQPTWKSETSSYRDATAHLARTYATDPNYATKLNQLIKHYHLTDFDHKKLPDLTHYNSSNPGMDNTGNDFKPFIDTNSTSPYPQGQCTWYVYKRMQQFDLAIGGDLGDAHNWNNRAQSEGYHVDTTPKTHSAVVFEAGQAGASSYYGHVAFVERVNDDGSIVISESNVKGLGIISYRTLDANTADQLSYISGK